MNIHRIEAGPVESRGHFSLAVYALFPQYGDFRTNTASNKRCRHVLGRVET